MLKYLLVRNFVIIEETEIPFHPGFTVITGETGAGKSILVGALNLILGQRANLNSVFDPNQKAVVEAGFTVHENYREFFEANDIDYEPLTIVRRELLPSNKSRAFINDTPVTLEILKEFSSQFVDLHQQHESLSLTSPDFQRMIVDLAAGTEILLNDYQANYKDWVKKRQQLDRIKTKALEAQQQRDYIEFQVNELTQVAIQDQELELIDIKLKEANNSEEIASKLQQLKLMLDEDDLSLSQALKQATSLLLHIQRLKPSYEDLYNRLNSLTIELDDIIHELNDEDIEAIDLDALQALEKRSDLLNHLAKKHQVNTTEELLNKLQFYQNELNSLEHQEGNIEFLAQEIQQIENKLWEQANRLSEIRLTKSSDFENRIEQILHSVGLEQSKIKVNITPTDQLKPTGRDEIEILFSANEGHAPRSLKEVASGGELSRLMLSLKSIIADKTTLPTMIFDEIDTGISGEVAKKVAHQFNRLADNHQIISITHLPQIAAKANHHLKVTKESINGQTRSFVQVLNGDDKIMEIAELLSGQNPSETTINAARELINA